MAKNEDEVKIIASIYQASVNALYQRGSCFIMSKSIRYIHRVDEALNLLDERSRELIHNDFIDYKPFWWQPYYSNQLYLRMRAKAVGSFLRHFYDN